MLDLTTEVKDLFKVVGTNKDIKIYFPSINQTFTKSSIVSYNLKEGICSDDEIRFGACEGSMVQLSIYNTAYDLSDLECHITGVIGENEYTIGIYKVSSCKLKEDKKTKSIIAYDTMISLDTDVTAWYNSLTFPTTLGAFRSSLLSYLGLTEVPRTLHNDSMTVLKTITPSELSGRVVLEAIEELNGAFGHINREGNFERIVLKPAYGLYPGTFYPGQEYPRSEYDTSYVKSDLIDETITVPMRKSVKFEEYASKAIFKLQIRQEEGDIGAIVGDDKGVIIDTQTGASISSSKSEKATADIKKIVGNYAQTVTVQGKNLFDAAKAPQTGDYNPSIVSDKNLGYVKLTSINPTPYTSYRAYYTKKIFGVGKTYRVSYIGNASGSNPILCSIGANRKSDGVYVGSSNPVTISDQNDYFLVFWVNSSANTLTGTYAAEFSNIQLEEGSTATAYAPFVPNSPSPDYPAPITMPSNFDVLACGKNLVDATSSYSVTSKYSTLIFGYVKIKEGLTYTLTFNTENTGISCYIHGNMGLPYTVFTCDGTKKTFTLTAIRDSSLGNVSFFARASETSSTATGYISELQIELGSTATSYESYTGNSVTVTQELRKLSATVYDSIEKVNDTRFKNRIGRVVFDGSADESWGKSSTYSGTDKTSFYISLPTIKTVASVSTIPNILSSHFAPINSSAASVGKIFMANNSANVYFAVNATIADITAFKTWLASNPVTVYYELATPTETIIPDITLDTYKGTTSITTNSNPQVTLTADYFCNTDNTYTITGNFLVFGKSAAELEVIARNAFANMAKRPYRPYESDNIGLPYLTPGDMLKFDQDDPVVGYMFQRTLTGIQSLRDVFSATGSEELSQTTSTNKKWMQNEGRMTKIQTDVDGVRVEVSDLASDTATQFVQTANEIALKVSASGVVQAINLSEEGLKIDVSKLDISGLVTITSLNTPGSVVIDGGNLKAGTVIADSVAAENITGTTITGKTIVGSEINGSTFTQTGSNGTASIVNGGFVGDYAAITSIGVQSLSVGTSINVGSSISLIASTGTVQASVVSSTTVNAGTVNLTYINGYSPIHTGNIGQQSVLYADTAASANNAVYAQYAGSISGLVTTNQITASNTGYGNIDFLGFDNAAGVGWVQANFEPIGSSDIRLKHDILAMDNIPDELFYSLKPKQFKYKTDTYGKGKFFGLIAQEVENAFKTFGLNPYDYDLVELKDVKAYSDDGYYVKGETHRIHYNNLIAWIINIVQKQHQRIIQLENIKNS